MKKLILIMAMLAIAGPLMAATPTPIPTPSVTPTPSTTPTPVPVLIPQVEGDHNMPLRANFSELTTGIITDQKLINLRDGQSFTVPAGHRYYITGINWSCQSAVIANLEWDCAVTDVIFDYCYFPSTGQGKVMNFIRPLTSLDPGISPVLNTDRPCTGWVLLNGFLK